MVVRLWSLRRGFLSGFRFSGKAVGLRLCEVGLCVDLEDLEKFWCFEYSPQVCLGDFWPAMLRESILSQCVLSLEFESRGCFRDGN